MKDGGMTETASTDDVDDNDEVDEGVDNVSGERFLIAKRSDAKPDTEPAAAAIELTEEATTDDVGFDVIVVDVNVGEDACADDTAANSDAERADEWVIEPAACENRFEVNDEPEVAVASE